MSEKLDVGQLAVAWADRGKAGDVLAKVVLVLHAESDHLELQGNTGGTGDATAKLGKGGARGLLDILPADAVGAVSVSGLGARQPQVVDLRATSYTASTVDCSITVGRLSSHLRKAIRFTTCTSVGWLLITISPASTGTTTPRTGTGNPQPRDSTSEARAASRALFGMYGCR